MEQFKNVAHYYLGSSLKGFTENKNRIIELKPSNLSYFTTPVLYPMSMLGKEIVVEGYNDGNSFVPIKDGFFDSYDRNWILQCHPLRLDFMVVEKLIQWHLNVFNLPEDQFINKLKI